MKLFEMKALPRNAGKAKLTFYEGKMPSVVRNRNEKVARVGNEIFLPLTPFAEYYPLLDGLQLLFRIPQCGMGTSGDDLLFFAGQDEEPFCVKLDAHAFDSFSKNGEDGFYHSLIPEQANELAKEIDTKLVRQGDIFGVSLKMPWEEVSRMSYLANGKSLKNVKLGKSKVYGTRHTIQGLLAEDVKILGQYLTVGEGLLEASDHAPKTLKDTHVLFQTQHLHNPVKAD